MDYTHVFGVDMVRPPWEYLEQMRATPYYLEKQKVIQQAIDEQNWIFIDGLKRATNPIHRIDVVYALYKRDTYAPGYTWKEFCELDDKIAARKYIRTVRSEMTQIAMELCNQMVWNNWFMPILNRDLHAGLSYKMLNQVLKNNGLDDLMIPLFYPQQLREVQSKQQCVSGDRIIDYKIDGYRLVVVADPEDTARMYDIRGRPITHYVNTINEYTNFAKHFLNEPLIFDGEIMSEEFYDLRTRGYKVSNMRITDAQHYVFDVLPWKEYLSRRFEQPLAERREVLVNMINRAHDLGYLTSSLLVKYTRMTLNTDTGENMDRLYEFLNESLQWGHEGVVIKNPAKPYKCYRSHDWLKLKPRITVDLVMKRFDQNEIHKGIRRVVCEGVDKDRYFIVNVGKGYCDVDRHWIWNNRHDLVGKHMEITGRSIIPPHKNKPHWTIECPAFSRLRPDLDQDDDTDSEQETYGD